MEYVMAAANLYGQIYGINGTRDFASIRKILEGVHVPSFTPKSSVKIHVTDKEMEEDKAKGTDEAGEVFQLADVFMMLPHFLPGFLFLYFLCVLAPDQARLEELKGKLASPSLKGSAVQMYPIDFEKVGRECRETSAEVADRLAAWC